MAINQYTFERRVIYSEFTYLEANTKKEAWKRVQSGDSDDCEIGDWYDYYDDDFELVDSTDNLYDPLVEMVRNYGLPVQLELFDTPTEIKS